ncbi:NAD(P)-dependent oxidoreductase (plasmid) [Skermanella rosea]|uniref:NAD-dependent epimerase/dehydratase family protein n=1 Tax=Skermanella rosea TaxID=1817965 RepID=UPI001932E1DA|nr:NAD(P)-dependent oxidoreductase [Skermanella rosea]UEM07652.1 NAD(P)-dependent oxidoreductase [Skermanella rosea]
MSDESTILVTGAAGLIGNAVRILLEGRGSRVLPVDRVSATSDGLPVTVCDVGDVHRLHALAVENRITGIVHCGAHSGPMVARDNPHSMVQVNIVGTANVLEIARIHGARFVFCSSTSAYGDTPEGPVPEDVPMNPGSVYGASKVAGEQLVSTYTKQYGVDGVSLRLSWVYGPRRTTDCVVRTMITDALAGRPTRIPFGRDFHRQFIHVEDAARALVMALDTPDLPRRTYNVTGGSYLTLAEIGEVVRGILPDADIELGEGADPVDDVQRRFDISAVERDLGFRPDMTFEQGVRAYADWLHGRATA